MFGMQLRVVTDGGAAEVKLSPRVIVEFERQFQTGLGRAFQTDQKAEHMFWLAWKASKAQQSFDDWLETVHDVELIEGGDRPLSGTP